MRWSALSLALALLVIGRVAHADPQGHKRALELAGQSSESYKAGRFDEAIAKLREAIALDPDPVLLFNLARVYESSGDIDHALESFRGYLDSAPNAEDRGAVEQRISTLDRQVRERDAARKEKENPTPTPTPTPPPTAVPHEAERPRSASPVPWIFVGTGAVGLGVGGVFGLLSLSTHDSAMKDPVQTSAVDSQSRAEMFSTIANVLFIAGGVVLAVGLVWGLVDVTGSKRHAAAASALRLVRGEVLSW